MCGIAGIIGSRAGQADLDSEIRKMTASLHHRGPDGEGHWIDSSGRVALGHRRLAILDLSVRGSQPMVSSSARFVIVLNGEIYNYLVIKDELLDLGYDFKSASDTEVLLEAIEEWGFDGALKKAVGMFAVAVYDHRDQCLYLARDRIGEKPLYYGRADGCFFFASELKALKALSCFKGQVDRNALALFLRYNYIPTPYSIYQEVSKLEPGTYLRIDCKCEAINTEHYAYWSLKDVVEAGREAASLRNGIDSVAEFDNLLRTVIGEQMIADVEVGAFLSGGIDSSLVVAIMQAGSKNRVKTFTIGFREDEFNEAHEAAAVAKHLGTDHNELYIGPEELLKLVPAIPHYYDEPFADSSLIPTCLVARLAKEQVKVVLSGDGGDELFGGYNTYLIAEKAWSGVKKLPRPLRKLGAGMIDCFSVGSIEAILKVPALLSRKALWINAERLKKLAELLPVTGREQLYKNLVSGWSEPEQVVFKSSEPETVFSASVRWPQADFTYLEWMMFIDAMRYLPDNNLVKTDRACMAIGLEARVPLLDQRVVEYAWQLPFNCRIKGAERKWLLKQALGHYIPRELTDRPKKGFSIPMASWLRGPLKEWAGDLISEARIKREGYFDYRKIEQRWLEHQQGERDWHSAIFRILMFEAWLDYN